MVKERRSVLTGVCRLRDTHAPYVFWRYLDSVNGHIAVSNQWQHHELLQLRGREMRKFLIVGLLLCSSAYAQQQCSKVIHVGAWNIQWLGNAKEGKRQPQTAEDVAGYIKASGVDILAVEEVSPTSGDQNETLAAALKLLSTDGAQWKHVLFKKRDGARAPNDQWTGLAWNESAVSMVGGPWPLTVNIDAAKEADIRSRLESKPGESADSTVILSRLPYAAKFSAGSGLSDFVVVPVHLKSNIGGPATAEARAYEAELIMQGLKTLPDKDDDVIVLGDTNMLLASEAAGQVLTSNGLKDCNARDLGTHIAFKQDEKPAPFDRIFVMRNQPETKDSCSLHSNGSKPLDFRIIRPSSWQQGITSIQFRKRLSDHQMVTAGLCVMKDDD